MSNVHNIANFKTAENSTDNALFSTSELFDNHDFLRSYKVERSGQEVRIILGIDFSELSSSDDVTIYESLPTDDRYSNLCRLEQAYYPPNSELSLLKILHVYKDIYFGHVYFDDDSYYEDEEMILYFGSALQ